MRLFMFSLLSILALTGCRSVWDPTFMPAGYTYHHEDYKSPPGPEAADIGYKYTAAENEAVMQKWRHAVRDLLLRARANDLDVPQNVFVQTDLEPSAFQGTYDSILREELRSYGHALTESGDGPALFYSAYDPENQGRVERDPAKGYNGDKEPYFNNQSLVPPKGNIELVLGLVQDGKWIKKVSGIYELPLYGFRPGGYVPAHESAVLGLSAPPVATENANSVTEER